jgi:hypothetical protein
MKTLTDLVEKINVKIYQSKMRFEKNQNNNEVCFCLLLAFCFQWK